MWIFKNGILLVSKEKANPLKTNQTEEAIVVCYA